MNPSLLLIPDRYKASKLYSQIPDSGAGDLAFTRANDTATRVNSAGLIEKVRTNITTHSEDFTNAAWVANAAPTITANTTVAPNGTTTADTIASTGANSGVYQLPSVSAGTPYAFSVYIKNISSATAISIGCDLNPINGALVFNAVLGTITSVGAGITASSVTNEGNGWYRVFGTYVATGSPNTFLVFGGGVMSFAVWGAMFQAGDILTPYIPTTTAAVSVGPVANIPRIDYTGGGCGKLLLEPQRTNLVLFSEQINNAAWNKLNTTISANQAVSPDGTTNADLVYPTTTGGDRLIEQTVVATTGQAWTSSFFVKASGFSWVLVYAPNLGVCWFNATTGQFGTVTAGVTARVLGQVNGFWRISFTATLLSSTSYFYAGTADANGSITSTTSGTNGLLFYGCQLELGSYATSYIPTLGASVTRSADAASKTGISSLIGTEFTIFYDGFETIGGQATRYLVLKGSGGTYANAVFIEGSSGNSLALSVLNNASANVFSAISASLINGQRIKFAVRCKDNDFAFYVNGSLVAAQASGSVPTTADLYLGYYVDFADNYSLPTTAAIYTSGLSNAELATLTSL